MENSYALRWAELGGPTQAPLEPEPFLRNEAEGQPGSESSVCKKPGSSSGWQQGRVSFSSLAAGEQLSLSREMSDSRTPLDSCEVLLGAQDYSPW